MAVHRKLGTTFIESIADVAVKALNLASAETTSTNGVISVKNSDGTATVIGLNSVREYVGDTTPPGVPVVSWLTGNGTIIGVWGGELEDEEIPDDFDHVVFRIDGEPFGELSLAGSTGSDALTVGQTYSCDAVAYDKQNNVSDASEAVEVTVTSVSEEWSTAYESIKAEYEAVESSLAEVESNLESLESDLESVKTDAATMAESLESVKSDAASLLTEVAEIQAALYDEESGLVAQITAAASTADEALEATTTITTTLTELSTELTEVYTTANSALTQIASLTETVEGISATVSSVYETANTALTNAATAQATADAITTKVETEYTSTEELTETLSQYSTIEQTSTSITTALAEYVTSDELDGELENYSTIEQTSTSISTAVANLVSSDELSSTLEDYSTVEQTASSITTALASYVTDEELDETLEDYSTITQTASEISTAVSGLVSSDELESTLAEYSTTSQTAEAISTAVSSLVSSDELEETLESYSTTEETSSAIASAVSSALYDDDGNAAYASSSVVETVDGLTTTVTTLSETVDENSDAIQDLDNDLIATAIEASAAYNAATALYGTCSTDADTAAKVVECDDFTLFTGASIYVYFENANTYQGALTLNVNGTGAKSIMYQNSTPSSSLYVLWSAAASIAFVYTGSKWKIADSPLSTTCSCSTAKATSAKTSSSGTRGIIYSGATLAVQFTYGSSSDDMTFNWRSTGDFEVWANGEAVSADNPLELEAGTSLTLVWSDTHWRIPDTSLSTIIRQTSDGIEISKMVGSTYTSSRSVLSDDSLEFLSTDGDQTLAKMDTDGFYTYADGVRTGAFTSDAIRFYNGDGHIKSNFNSDYVYFYAYDEDADTNYTMARIGTNGMYIYNPDSYDADSGMIYNKARFTPDDILFYEYDADTDLNAPAMKLNSSGLSLYDTSLYDGSSSKYAAKFWNTGVYLYQDATQTARFSSDGAAIGYGSEASTKYNKLFLDDGGIRIFTPESEDSGTDYAFTISSDAINPDAEEAYFRVNTDGDVGIGGSLYVGSSYGYTSTAAFSTTTVTLSKTGTFSSGTGYDFYTSSLSITDGYRPVGVLGIQIPSYKYALPITSFYNWNSKDTDAKRYVCVRCASSISSSTTITIKVTLLLASPGMFGSWSSYEEFSAKKHTIIDIEGLEDDEEEEEEEYETDANGWRILDDGDVEVECDVTYDDVE